MHVFIDLKSNKIIGIWPEMGRAPKRIPITDDKLVKAEKIALNHPIVNMLRSKNIKSYLTAIYYTSEYPNGIAFFSIRSNNREVLVAVDLGKMVVVEKYTVPVLR